MLAEALPCHFRRTPCNLFRFCSSYFPSSSTLRSPPNLVLDVEKGNSAPSALSLVVLKNLDAIQESDATFGYGNIGLVRYGGTVTAVGLSGDSVLVRYSRDPKLSDKLLLPCPNGAVFFLKKEKFREWQIGLTEKLKEERRLEQRMVNELLKNG
jgi:hypothetical protein